MSYDSIEWELVKLISQLAPKVSDIEIIPDKSIGVKFQVCSKLIDWSQVIVRLFFLRGEETGTGDRLSFKITFEDVEPMYDSTTVRESISLMRDVADSVEILERSDRELFKAYFADMKVKKETDREETRKMSEERLRAIQMRLRNELRRI